MSGKSLAARLCAVAAVSVVSVSAEAALSCPFADGNGGEPGRCIEGQGTWQRSLQARDWDGNGVVDGYYDSFLNLSWLADADLAGVGMNFSDAKDWAAGLTLFGVTDWRLPTVTPVDGTANFNIDIPFSNNGSTDVGTARTEVGWGKHSEMGYMFYVHLGNKGLFAPDDASPDSAVVQAGWGLANTGPFVNLQPEWYSPRANVPRDSYLFPITEGSLPSWTLRLLPPWQLHPPMPQDRVRAPPAKSSPSAHGVGSR